MGWDVQVLWQVEDWLLGLDDDSYDQVAAAIDLLSEVGPTLGRPLVDRIKSSTLHHLKELRPGSAGGTEIRVLFIFDPARRAVLLVAGDKAGSWKHWYAVNIPVAERRYDEWLGGDRDE